MFSRENGFTLIELMVVIAISTLVIAGMGISYAKSLPDRRLAKAARNLYNDLQMARSKAVLNMENIDVVFNEQNNQYLIQISANDVTGAPAIPIKSVNLSDYKSGIRFGAGCATRAYNGSNFDGNYVTYRGDSTSFQPNGLVSEKGYVFLTNNKNSMCYAVATPTSAGTVQLHKTGGETWPQ